MGQIDLSNVNRLSAATRARLIQADAILSQLDSDLNALRSYEVISEESYTEIHNKLMGTIDIMNKTAKSIYNHYKRD